LKTIFYILFILLPLISIAQKKEIEAKKPAKINAQDKNVKLLMHDEYSYGLGLNTNGWTLAYNKTKIVHFTKKKFWEIEFSKIKGDKETKTDPVDYDVNRPMPKKYVYGKRNSLFVLEYRKGINYKLTQKSIKNGVEISWNTSAGLTLGLLKPYYLVLKRGLPDNLIEYSDEKYSASNDSIFLNKATLAGIYGYSGFWKGIGRTVPMPGFNARIGLNFDWAAYDENISSLEVGLKINMFLTTVPLMINKHNYQIFPSFFAIYKIGERKY
jgi:hypothetical protein